MKKKIMFVFCMFAIFTLTTVTALAVSFNFSQRKTGSVYSGSYLYGVRLNATVNYDRNTGSITSITPTLSSDCKTNVPGGGACTTTSTISSVNRVSAYQYIINVNAKVTVPSLSYTTNIPLSYVINSPGPSK